MTPLPQVPGAGPLRHDTTIFVRLTGYRDGCELGGDEPQIACERVAYLKCERHESPARVRGIGPANDETGSGQLLNAAHGRAGRHVLHSHAERGHRQTLARSLGAHEL